MKRKANLVCVVVTALMALSLTMCQPAIDEPATLANIAIKTEPSKKIYFLGDELNLDGLEVEALYSDETMGTVAHNELDISGFDSESVGRKTVTVSYEGKSDSFTVTVKAVEVTSVTVKTEPSKKDYFVGAALKLDGLVVEAGYSDETTEVIANNELDISGFDSETAGEKTVTVSYGGKTDSFTVTVKAVEVTSVTVKTEPSKKDYFVGDELELDGLEVEAVYGDEIKEIIANNELDISGFDSESVGEKTVTVSYGGKNDTFTVTVKKNDTIDSVELLREYLESLPANDAESAYPVKVALELGLGRWSMFYAIAEAGIFVKLDLSKSTEMEIFHPGARTGGESLIVALVLPDTSTVISEPSLDPSLCWQRVFQNFTSLKTISGAGIKTMCGDAFRDMPCLTRFDFPALESIGDYAFSGCSGLTEVTIPDSVTSIGDGAFWGCSGLTSVTIADGVTSIGESAFNGCSGLTEVTIPDGVTSFGYYAFANCSGLTEVTIPGSVTSFGGNAFVGCSGLTSVTIADGVTSIGSYAFYYCSGLTSVTIPDSVTSIGYNAFAYCSGLTSVTIPGSVTSIGGFNGCSGLTSVTIADGVTSSSIEDDAFNGCGRLTSVIIPGGVTSIGNRAFSDSGLTEVIIPDSVTSIGSSTFFSSRLTSVAIPASVTYIGGAAFDFCISLTEVIFEGADVIFSENGSFLYDLESVYNVGKAGTYIMDNYGIWKKQ